ncbi:sulfur carrier protein ThiS [Paenibacillus sp. ACRRX]|uniref:sulfur carrier protein ThiS n=1 Tax=unclassified Paenibacillus TaxID=185978 RepID=UPI001EF72B90|nr:MULTISPECIES: sulfur carrier protein ThiS [unclassified Paenibacillus]MCG7407151.1 sulfur carrier protein ThiS [Paenibacillus sp. ACRRX]MDK8180371.1 sulfur carrier protein ThiS [Paenibacillus sp. UMB4589-SE434]
MELRVNGHDMELSMQEAHIQHLIEHLHMTHRIVIVEHNGTIVPKHKYEATTIMNGDRIEIVHFVGGG